MIELITTVETIEQAEQLLAAGADTLYFGEEQFGLRLPASFTREEQRQLVELAHKYGKKANIAVNGIIHPEKMKNVPEYLAFLKEINVDVITVGDTGIIYTMKKNPELRIPYIYDAETLVTSARQINFWAKNGAVGAVLAREVPFEEMKAKSLCMVLHASINPNVHCYRITITIRNKTNKKIVKEVFLSRNLKKKRHIILFMKIVMAHIFLPAMI